MEFKPTKTKSRRAAFTVMEMLVGVSVGMLVLAAVGTFFLFSLRSFGSLANYTDLNSKDRYAGDLLTRDIRNAISVVSSTANQLVLQPPPAGGTNRLTYTYDATARTLTRTDSSSSKTLLTGVASCAFTIYQRPTTNVTYGVFPSGSVSTAKLVAYQWSCTRHLVGSRSESESVQTGKVSIRNE
jgi:hypothetical protein